MPARIRRGGGVIEAARPEDPPAQILGDWYRCHYNEIAATADGSFFHRFMHEAMERRYANGSFSDVLEVGANRGEHVPFVLHRYDQYLLTDLEPPDLSAVAGDPRVRAEAADVTALPYADGSFDRVISTCVLHHVSSPLMAAAQMRRVTRPGGAVTILVPTDPGLAYRVGRALTSGRKARRAGLAADLRLVSALDHRNHFRSIRTQVEHAFRRDELVLDWQPFRVASVDVNAFVVAHVRRGAD